MRVIVGFALLVVAGGCEGSDEPEPKTPEVRVIHDCAKSAERPREILVVCGDGSYRVASITYAEWTEGSARGTGTVWANDFNPDRAQGRDRSYPATFVLSDARDVRGERIFTKITVRYVAANPHGESREEFPLSDLGISAAT